MDNPINLLQKCEQFHELWSPKIIAPLNNYFFKLAKFKGEFTWHSHPKTDEAFYVLEGEMQINFEDHSIHLKQGELFIVPKGVRHQPAAENECKVLLIEPKETINTGDTPSYLSNEAEWI